MIPGYKASSHHWGGIVDICSGYRSVFYRESSQETLAAVPWTKDDHTTPPSCFVVKIEWLFTQVGIKSNSEPKRRQKRPLLRPTGERGKQPQTNFVSSLENAWEGHRDSACQIHIRTRVRRELKWQIGGCRALRRCGCARKPECTQFRLFWNFARDRLASRMYAATATTFLMKLCNYHRFVTQGGPEMLNLNRDSAVKLLPHYRSVGRIT